MGGTEFLEFSGEKQKRGGGHDFWPTFSGEKVLNSDFNVINYYML